MNLQSEQRESSSPKLNVGSQRNQKRERQQAFRLTDDSGVGRVSREWGTKAIADP